MDLESLIKLAESIEVAKGTTINININSSGAQQDGYAVDKLKSLNLEADIQKSSVDEETKKQAIAHLEILKKLMSGAKQVDAPTEHGNKELRRDTVKVENQAYSELRDRLNALAGITTPNGYAKNYGSTTSPGILGVNASPNKGSGESMNAHKELLARLVNKSMMGTPGNNEILKLRSDNPLQEYLV
jgi:leucyl aminopeptidase (aminopeptidase T)